MNQKVAVIGFDGASFDIIESLVLQGKLENFQKIMKAGAYGKLKSTIPPISPPAWASIATGVNPGKHGVFDFFEVGFENGERRKEKREHPICSNSIKAKKLWEYIDEYGLKSIIVNFPIMYPPEKLNHGMTVSGFITPSGTKVFTHPEKLAEELLTKGYEIEVPEEELYKLLHSDKQKLFERFIETMEKRAEVAADLMQKYDWNFFMVVFGESDRIQHYFFDNKELLFQCYKKLDDVLGKLIKQLDKDVLIFIISDHGFSQISKYFYINQLLKNNGLLFLEKIKFKKQLFANLGLSRNNILSFMEKTRTKKLVNFIPNRIGRLIPDSVLRVSEIDVNKSKAYCASAYGYVYLNSENTAAKNKTQCDFVIKQIQEINDTAEGEIIEKIFTKEELYSGSYLEAAPDIIVIAKKPYALHYKLNDGKIFESIKNATGLTKRSGEHDEGGIFFAYGSDIKKCEKIENATVYDFTPTILYSLGIPVERNIDGRIIDEIFNSRPTKTQPLISHFKIDEKKMTCYKIKELKKRKRI